MGEQLEARWRGSLIRILVGVLAVVSGADKVWRYAHEGVWWRAITGGLLAVIGIGIAVSGLAGAWHRRRTRESQSDAPAV